VNNSKRRATVTSWGLVVLGALFAAACGSSPDWQNQYTEEPNYSGGGDQADSGSGSPAAEDSGPACAVDTPNCNTIESAFNPSVPVVIDDPQGNPDPVPWAEHPVTIARKSQ
jgi:hypothetical protein